MSDPSSPSGDKSMQAHCVRSPPWQWKDVVIAVLALLLLSMSAYAFRIPWHRWRAPAPGGGEEVSVFDVVVDRDGRQYFDVLFDHPLGEGKGTARFSIRLRRRSSRPWAAPGSGRTPTLCGSSRAAGFRSPASTRSSSIRRRSSRRARSSSGETELTVKTDKFLVEEVDVTEEPALEGKAKVVFRGEIRFNYAVNPETLAPLVKLVDPEATEPIEVKLETDYQNQGHRLPHGADRRRRRTSGSPARHRRGAHPRRGERPARRGVRQGDRGRLEHQARGAERRGRCPGLASRRSRSRFSSPISAAVAEKYVKLEPAVPRCASRPSATSCRSPARWSRARPTRSTIGKGMPATDEASLQEDYSEDVELPDLEPTVGFQSQGMFLWSQGQHAVALEAVNVAQGAG